MGGVDVCLRCFGGFRVVDIYRRRVVRGWFRVKMG